MSSYINTFLSTELTCIPQIMNKLAGGYFNNSVGNALTWAFILWGVLHYIFDESLNALMKRMRFKQYVRQRVIYSLWYCGFYGTSLFFCCRNIFINNDTFDEYRHKLLADGSELQINLHVLGLFGTFFAHSLTWELLYSSDPKFFNNLALSSLPLVIIYTRRIELYFTLIAILSNSEFVYNLLRLAVCLCNFSSEYTTKVLLYIAFGFFVLGHILLAPILIIVPLVIYQIKNGFSPSLLMLLVTVIIWWIFEGLANPLMRYIKHWLSHNPNDTSKEICPGLVVECALFQPRDDVLFNLELRRKEMKDRQTIMIARRKPKNRGALIQTLKCMVAIKRKLGKARAVGKTEKSESSESEEEEEEEEEDSSPDASEVGGDATANSTHKTTDVDDKADKNEEDNKKND